MLIILFVAGVAALIYLYCTKKQEYWKKKRVPFASRCNWFLGHYKPFLLAQKPLGIVFQDMYNEYPEEPYVGYMKFTTPGLAIRHPDLIKTVLSNEFNIFGENEMKVDKNNDFLLGNNPFVLQGQEWRNARGHMTPLITFVKLKQYFPAIRSVCKEMVRYIEEKAGDGLAEIETKKLSGMYTTDVITNAILGIVNNTFQDSDSVFGQLTSEILASGFIDNLKLFMALTFPGLVPYLGLRLSSRRLEKTLLALSRKQMNEISEPDQLRHDIFQQLKTFRNNDKLGVFTDHYIASICFSFLADGYETSSDLMCFALYELAWNSDVQEKLREEIMCMIEETNDDYGVERVEKLAYLDMVLNESLRMYTPAQVLTKICTEDYKIPEYPLTIEKGTPVSIPVYAIHLDEKFYPNPTKFDPERFTDQEVADRNKFIFLPFGEGPRKCVGQRLALLQVKLGVINIIQKFRLKPSPRTKYPVQLDPAVFLSRPLNGAWIHIESLRK